MLMIKGNAIADAGGTVKSSHAIGRRDMGLNDYAPVMEVVDSVRVGRKLCGRKCTDSSSSIRAGALLHARPKLLRRCVTLYTHHLP